MNQLDLIGKVATEYLRANLNMDGESEGVARFLLDRLTGRQVARICEEILSDIDLSSYIEIKVPCKLVEGYNLPEEVTTDEKTTYWRNAPLSKPAIILANTNDDQGQSLRDITTIGANDLKSNPEFWVNIASAGLALTAEQKKYWKQALNGLQSISDYSLEKFSQYVVEVRNKILNDSVPLISALGWALSSLRIPRDSALFEAIPEKYLGHKNRWADLYLTSITKRACYLIKQYPNREIIENEDLQSSYNKVKEDIPDHVQPIIESFIQAKTGWTMESEALADFEWERDSVYMFFSGIKTKKVDLGTQTLEHLEDEYSDIITQDDRDYLDTLSKRTTTEPSEEDREFYETHRQELDTNRSLKSKWDRFVYGKPIECDDFIIGLLEAVERLFSQSENISSKKKLRIRTQKRNSKSSWLELNANVGLFFSTRYKGLDRLTHPNIIWDVHWLFKYDELLEDAKNKPKYRKNISVSQNSIQIKFYVELEYENDMYPSHQVQLIWKGDPNKIGLELRNDLFRLDKKPFPLCRVSKNPISKKGKLQGISLNDVGTLHAVYRQNRGSLIGVYSTDNDLKHQFTIKLNETLNEGRLSREGYEEINKSWGSFSKLYKEALNGFLVDGLSSEMLLLQCDAYDKLLRALREHASSDKNRVELWQPILNIGNVHVDGTQPMSIIAPWHPMRLASLAIKAIQFEGLVRYILESEEVDFGDSKLFFSDLKHDFTQPYYPEVTYGFRGNEPELLSISDTVNDYSLMEMPVKKFSDQETNEDPKEASSKVSTLVQKYIELQPHESTNLSVVLYNCDSTRLPKAIVDSLSLLRDKNDDIRCQVILRHRNMDKLSELYTKMVENTDSDPDKFVASEESRDFMARLRIGVMADQAPLNEFNDEKPSDIVFLQEVISREAKFVWSPVKKGNVQDLLKHYPPRWSRRRPAAKDELKSTAYLVCPSQPSVGWSYLTAVQGVCEAVDTEQDNYYLPSRQISFQNEETRSIFDEAHKIGEWVANYDELLDQRLLRNQGVNVIKYQHNQSIGPNLVVSTKSKLNLLQILVKRRLGNLNLGLADEELVKLAELFIKEANALSGDIVLRAAKRGKFASELLGVVLSKLLITSEIGESQSVGWFFLDDYASWLGKKEEQIADILALCPREENGKLYLQVIISECKYIDIKGLANAKKTSQKQLSDTVIRINNALFGSPSRLDRDLWLARISDMLVEGVEFFQDSTLSLEEWREGIRKGEIPIDLRGYSHVFVSSSSDESNLECEQIQLNNIDNCYQEVYNREKVRKLALGIFGGEPLNDIRKEIGDERPWELLEAVSPSTEINIENTIFKNKDRSSTEARTDNNKVDTDLNKQIGSEKEEQGTSGFKNEISDSHSEFGQEEKSFWGSPALKKWIDNNDKASYSNNESEEWLNEVERKLKTALMSYNLQAKVLGSRLTPNSGIIRLKGSDNLKVEDIERKKSQLLTTHALEIINVVGRPGEIVVFITRPERQVIYLNDLWNRRKVEQILPGMNMNFLIGVKEVDGELLYLNLGGQFEGLQQHAPHTLIAGATGSGKSIMIQNLILDICATNSKEMAKVYLIDPKFGVDYQSLEDLPHLTEGIIIDQEKATSILESLVSEMESRYLTFRDNKVPNIKEYNKKAPSDKKMPLIFLIHDEFADWMLVDEYKNTVSASVQRLGVKARAAGIHLIFAAQRPDKDALPVQLRDNLGNRLILKVESSGTSEIALGEKGAERLLDKGHLAARLSGESSLIFAQVPFLSSEDSFDVVSAIKQGKFS
ncbi:FtsK/SpoIIIE domain-containing protein [Mesobacillus subterraneus]|uniref:FtsK/SpoIIIE domain-containing protein n=1 Tax=Mesobacillus subterraneus TaxID=285983 RepID=UPI0020422559|nr:FtsK/SpoIIIE domain-containing protein [Mesobacillus subterraneus]MCM3665841.1 FtsK/SpoIIIE domain-containing protein [Mesobacillus subterraneus]MCM3684768.1 FtsK/SpoIIIE domain-containing protein [Mesobacillus subterraneus]